VLLLQAPQTLGGIDTIRESRTAIDKDHRNVSPVEAYQFGVSRAVDLLSCQGLKSLEHQQDGFGVVAEMTTAFAQDADT
jgi:hypothetical protein